MLKRKHIVLAGAVAAALPAFSRAATVTFSYDSTVSLFKNASQTITDGTTQISGNAVTIPAGDYFTFGVSVAVTGNTNPARTGGTAGTYSGTAPSSSHIQPTALGLGLYSIAIADGNFSKLKPVGADGTTNTNQDSTASIDTGTYSAATSAGYIQQNGTVGENDGGGFSTGTNNVNDALSGVINTTGVSTSTASLLADIHGATDAATNSRFPAQGPVQLFSNLEYSLASGTANGTQISLTPVYDTAKTGVATYLSGGTAATQPPVYGSRALNGTDTVNFLAPLVVTASAVQTGHAIISLTASGGGVASGYGQQITSGSGDNKGTFNPPSAQNKLTVSGSGGGYGIASVTNINGGAGDTTDSVEGNGFNPISDKEIYALDVLGLGSTTPAQLAALINSDPNAQSGTGMTASATYPGAGANPFPGIYNLFLSFTSPPSGDNFLGFDFSTSNDSALPSGLTVAAVALVPEPATAAVMLFGASGLLLGRRKRKA